MENYLEKVKFIVAKEKENRAEEIKSCIQQIKSMIENKITQIIEIDKYWPFYAEKLEYVETISESERIYCYITSASVEIAYILEKEDTHHYHVIRVYNSGKIEKDYNFDMLRAYQLFLKYFPKLENHVHSIIDKRLNDLQESEVKNGN